MAAWFFPHVVLIPLTCLLGMCKFYWTGLPSKMLSCSVQPELGSTLHWLDGQEIDGLVWLSHNFPNILYQNSQKIKIQNILNVTVVPLCMESCNQVGTQLSIIWVTMGRRRDLNDERGGCWNMPGRIFCHENESTVGEDAGMDIRGKQLIS